MAKPELGGQLRDQRLIRISHRAHRSEARTAVREMASDIGFKALVVEELLLVTDELTSNLLTHSSGGRLGVGIIEQSGRLALQISTFDSGPPIKDPDRLIVDGVTSGKGLGYGLGTVHRLTDEMEINPSNGSDQGNYIVCRRWLRVHQAATIENHLSFGVSSRPAPGSRLNGDAYLIKKWGDEALVAVIDGLGHGQHAFTASQKARRYLERHYDLPMDRLFRGVGRECSSTRGVVMAAARFNGSTGSLTYGTIGNIEARLWGTGAPVRFPVRRGILGFRTPNAGLMTLEWRAEYVLTMFSDGIRSHWDWADFGDIAVASPQALSKTMLDNLTRENDDATVLVIKGRPQGAEAGTI